MPIQPLRFTLFAVKVLLQINLYSFGEVVPTERRALSPHRCTALVDSYSVLLFQKWNYVNSFCLGKLHPFGFLSVTYDLRSGHD